MSISWIFSISLVQTIVSLRLVILNKMDLSIRFLILVLFGLVLGGSAQESPQVDLLLNQTEASLLELVNQVQANDLNSCDLLSTCNSESTCSRLACPLTNANTTGYACQGVLQNTNCNDNCPWRKFDYSRSVIRVPGLYAATDYISPGQLRGICAQRNLDSFFQKHSNNTNFFYLYFGSVDGTFRIFPGMDDSDCGLYDPRKRLWYLTSTTNVKKAVMVLIDSGSSMAAIIPSTSSDSNLATAFTVTESFLNTTFQNDYVNIFTFGQANVNSSSPQPVLVTNTSTHSDFGNFTATLSGTPHQSSVLPGNITNALSKVITSSAGFGSTEIQSEYLKVIILITDSNAVDAISNAPLPWDLIKSNNISVFLYMFPTSTAAKDYSPLASQLCAARGYFQTLDGTVSGNPLLALEAYYSFVANVHSTYVNSGIDYSTEYLDYTAVDNRTFTLSKAVFSNNGELVGVAAIDIFKTKLLQVYGITGQDLEEAISNRANLNTNFNASTGINTKTCLNQTSNQTCNQVNISNIVCSSNFNTDTTALRKLSCCGTCTGADKPGDLPLALGLGLGLGIPALILVVALVAWLITRRENRRDTFSGEDEDVNDRADR